MAFNKPYVFGVNNLVVLKHQKGAYLRINPQDKDQLQDNGGTGGWAQWQIELHGEQDDLPVVKLKHNSTGKYLRIYNDGETMDVGGGGGKWTRFKVHKTGDNSAKLESCELEGKYPAVQPGGPAIGGGGKWTEFEFFRRGTEVVHGPADQDERSDQKGGGPYENAYFFNSNKQIVLCGFFGKYLRVQPGNFGDAEGNGGTGGLARWNVELDGEEDDCKVAKFQNTKTNKYLRIVGNDVNVGGGGGPWTRFKVHATSDNSFKLESVKLPGKYVAVQPNGLNKGGGGKYTEFSLWSSEPDEEPEAEPVEEVPVEEPVEPEAEPEPEPEPEAEPEPEPEPEAEPEPEPEPEAEPEPEPEPEAEPVEEEPVEEEPVEEEKYLPPQFEESETHSQPLPGARPSIEANGDFSDDIAKEKAEDLRKAMKGLGTNEKKIIAVTTAYNLEQRQQIKAAYNAEYERDLMEDFAKELGGKVETMVVALWAAPGRYDAEQVNEAVDGLGFSTALLNEIICTRTNEQLELMQAAWWKGMSIIDRVKKETHSGNGNYCNLLVTLLEGKRPPNGPADADQAKLDAEMLNRYVSQEKTSAAKPKFVEVFTTRSWVQIREISGIFQDISKKYTLNGAVEKAFGDGDTARALQTIDEFASQPYDYWAKRLQDSMKGMGTDDEQLRRILVTRTEIDLRDIAIVFGQRYGEGKTLANWMRSDTSGDYEDLCLAICQLE